MEIIIRGDKIKVTDSINDYITEKLHKLEKYFDNSFDIRATVFFKVRNHSQKIEVTIPLKKFILRAEEEREDVYAAMDVVIDKIERQIRKNKTKLQSKKIKENKEIIFDEIEDFDENNEGKIVKRKTIDVKPMSEEEAIIQMELLGHNFYLFKDSNSLKPVLIYKRNDNNYGVIETE